MFVCMYGCTLLVRRLTISRTTDYTEKHKPVSAFDIARLPNRLLPVPVREGKVIR